MTDWNKLKVVDLKSELKKRGLAQTGLKPTLVARLSSAEHEEGSESEATVQGDNSKQNGSSTTSPGAPSPTPQSSHLAAEVPQNAAPGEPAKSPGKLKETTSTAIEVPFTPEIEEPQPQPPSTVEPPTQIPDTHHSALPSAEPQEVLDDRRKRKRRSQSPPPTSIDSVRKRARNDAVDIARNEEAQQSRDETRSSSIPPSMPLDAMSERSLHGTSGAGTGADDIQSNGGGHEHASMTLLEETRDGMELDEIRVAGEEGAIFDSKGGSPSRARHPYKELFTAQQRTFSPDRNVIREPIIETMETEPERIVSPAIHPATASLYIRDFMRPINKAALKAHLADLATPPGQDTDLQVITTFYLDPICTHAFVSFTNVSAASRVRSAIHDRIWPEERTRKPLRADFIPVEKAEHWIEEEQSRSSDRRTANLKWEVLYEVDNDRNVTASLQELSSFSRAQPPPRQSSNISLTSHLPTPRGIEGAPSGPRATQTRGQRVATGLSALSQLFKCTTTKPALYWQPVDKAVVDKRLENMESATSKAPLGPRMHDDINRYTFEDGDVLVDRGLEIFPGIRPPPGHSGPRGGYRGGGPWQGRGIGRAPERNDGYGRNRRDTRDNWRQ